MNEQLRAAICAGAKALRKLHADHHLAYRGHGDRRAALYEFHSNHDRLAMPGGLARCFAGVAENDEASIDLALTYLEVRPYYFRSQYHFKAFLRALRRAKLSTSQITRLENVRAQVRERKGLHRARESAPCTRCGHKRFLHDWVDECNECHRHGAQCKLEPPRIRWEYGA